MTIEQNVTPEPTPAWRTRDWFGALALTALLSSALGVALTKLTEKDPPPPPPPQIVYLTEAPFTTPSTTVPVPFEAEP